MSEQLKKLINDISTNPDIEESYRSDPDSVLQKYQVSDEEKKLMLNEDTSGIRDTLGINDKPSSIEKIIKIP